MSLIFQEHNDINTQNNNNSNSHHRHDFCAYMIILQKYSHDYIKEKMTGESSSLIVVEISRVVDVNINSF